MAMSTTAKSAGRGLATNWDLALTSSALLVIVGGIAAPHVRRLIAGAASDDGRPQRAIITLAVPARSSPPSFDALTKQTIRCPASAFAGV